MVEHCPFKAGVLGSSPSRLTSGGAQRGNNNLPINHLALCSKHYSPKFLRPGESIERSRTEWHSNRRRHYGGAETGDRCPQIPGRHAWSCRRTGGGKSCVADLCAQQGSSLRIARAL